jgi:hypothetical protein
MGKKTEIMRGPDVNGADVSGEAVDGQKTEVVGVDPILRKGAATYFKGFFNTGGQLMLTERSLIFKPHVLNVKRKGFSIPLNNIVGVERRNTLFAIPNGFGVVLRDGTRERFVVYGREEWIEQLVEVRSRISKPIKTMPPKKK